MAKTIAQKLGFNQSALYLVVGAAIAIGTYFLLSAFAGKGVSASFAPAGHGSSFKRGEMVNFSLTNKTKEVVRLHNSAPWEVKDSSGKTIYSPVSLQEIRKLEPANTIYWTWNQRGKNGQRVADGSYRILIKYKLYGRDLTETLPFRITR